MCLLTFFPDGVVPSDKAIEGLQNGAIFNSDGHGFAIVAGEHIVMQRGLNPDKVIASFIAQRERYPEGPALFHSRIGTAGHNSKRNCHPFYVGKDRRTVLAHNGILPKSAQPNKGDHRSDTRILAEELLPAGIFGNPMDCKPERDMFERWMTPYNKIVILTTNPQYEFSSYIFNKHMGEWDYGVWWSNDSYCPYVPRYTALSYAWDNGEKIVGRSKVDYKCYLCGQEHAVDQDYRVCWSCGYCVDCEMSWSRGDCLCYTRSRGLDLKTTTTVIGAPKKDPIGISCSNCKRDIVFCECPDSESP